TRPDDHDRACRTREATTHTRTHDTGTPGIKNRTYDPQQDCARPLLNMPASSSRSGFHVSASILWQSQSFVKPVFSILVNMRIVFCFITLEPSDSDFRPGVSPSYHEKYILFLVTA
ncbi:hypothetical protein ACLUWU_05505, partial [Bifidobacterium thermophilum]|uniref:hypothetical protein n=1 Tax=Bifidobacterium thermophilum TaxID=33905 RepID=UPI0039968E3F